MSFHRKLLVSFTIIFSLLIFCSSFYIYFSMSKALVETELGNMRPSAQKLSNQSDMLCKEIDNAALSYVGNKNVFNLITEINYSYDGSSAHSYASKLSTYLTSIYYNFPSVYKIIIFNPSEKFFYIYLDARNNVTSMPEKYKSDAEIKKMFRKNRQFVFSRPHLDDWSTLPREVISLYRKFSNSFYDDFGILELQIPYSIFEDICTINPTESSNSVLVFDENSEPVFPYYPAEESENKSKQLQLYKAILETGKSYGEVNINNKKTLFSLYKSSYTGLTTVVTNNKSVLLSRISFYKHITILIGISIFLLTLLVYYMLLRHLTTPLKTLITNVKNVSLNNLAIELPNDVNDEFKLLNNSFEKMFNKLKVSINKEYESKLREIASVNSALQAQINPHFIYNTLSVIIARSEDNESEIATKMCYCLSDMMRYTAGTSKNIVALSDELLHTKNYLILMRLNYDIDTFVFQIDIAEEMMSLPIPKLILQPIVENCINHGFKKTLPPWEIKISGSYVNEKNWELQIEDNGHGFEEAALEKIRKELMDYRQNMIEGNLLSNLDIGGMGLLNTFARLLIHYGKRFCFTVENLQDKGSILKLGIGEDEETC